MLAPAGPSVPVRRVVVGAAVVGVGAAVVGAADVAAVWAVVATGVPAVGHAAVGERATAATSAADAAEYRIRMGPRFLFSGRRAKVQGQRVDNVTNRHTPVDGATRPCFGNEVGRMPPRVGRRPGFGDEVGGPAARRVTLGRPTWEARSKAVP